MRSVILPAAALLLATCTPSGPGRVDHARLRAADTEPGQWLAAGRSWTADRFSPLAQIADSNATRLGLAWEYEARVTTGRVEYGMETSPLFVDGTLYFSGPWGSAYAVDARTGQAKWVWKSTADGSAGRRACCGVVNRGLVVWQGLVYVGTLDGYLVALDAATGVERWRADTFIDRTTRSYTITSAPTVAGDVVVIGNSGGEFGVRGYVTAYDLRTGAQRWRFWTVPGDPRAGAPETPAVAAAARTWGDSTDWQSGLGGTVWGEMVYDPDLDLLYVGTGNSTPYSGWHRDPSRRDNLYLVSILAIDPDDGTLRWHYQQVPWELRDYTATMNMILAELPVNGRVRKVLMQAPKNGLFYVLDRATGEFLSGTPYVTANWLTGLDSTGRPTLNPDAVYRDRSALVFPTQSGGHNWQPMAFSPVTGLAFIPARESGMLIWNEPGYRWKPGDMNLGAFANFGHQATAANPKAADSARARDPKLPSPDTRELLIAWDVAKRTERWRVPLAGPAGSTEWGFGGVLTTAGNLVIAGDATGELVLYRADTGERLHAIPTGTGIMAAPITYELDDVQYVAVLAGWGGALAAYHPPGTAAFRYENYGRLLVFRLGGGAVRLPPERPTRTTPAPPAMPGVSDAPEAVVARGRALFGPTCGRCHGAYGEGQRSAYPDLFRLDPLTHQAFESIVLGGARAGVGMASFADVLTRDDARAIQAFLMRGQRELVRAERAAAAAPGAAARP